MSTNILWPPPLLAPEDHSRQLPQVSPVKAGQSVVALLGLLLLTALLPHIRYICAVQTSKPVTSCWLAGWWSVLVHFANSFDLHVKVLHDCPKLRRGGFSQFG